jgi:hypothetical protein
MAIEFYSGQPIFISDLPWWQGAEKINVGRETETTGYFWLSPRHVYGHPTYRDLHTGDQDIHHHNISDCQGIPHQLNKATMVYLDILVGFEVLDIFQLKGT